MYTVEEANEVVSTRIVPFYKPNPESVERVCVALSNAPEEFYAESNLAQFAAQGVDIHRAE